MNYCMSHSLRRGKRGPIEVIENKGVKIPIYFSPIRGAQSYQLAFCKAGKRKRERTGELEVARKRARELIEELASGAAHFGTFTPRQTVMINEIVEMLKPLNVPLTEAVRQFAEAHTLLAGQGSILEAVRPSR
jgi:hypothetical protein